MKIIDLSVPLNNDTSVFPGDPEIKIKEAAVFEKNGYTVHSVCMGTHSGTHVDAPCHMLENGEPLDKIPIERFCGRGVYIEAEKEPILEAIKRADIKKGDIILIHTGMDDKFGKAEYYAEHPAITEEAARYLVAKKVSMVGVDMCSIDYKPFPAHKILLSGDVVIIENLTNLPILRGKEFKVYAFPIKLQLDGGPARVVAELL